MADVNLADYLAGLWYYGPALYVDPSDPYAKFSTIAEAITYLSDNSLDGVIYLMNGTHTCSGAISLPDQNIAIIGQSQGGAIVQNNAGNHLFTIYNCTSSYTFQGFTIDSQNSGTYTTMIYAYGSAAANNTASLQITNVIFDLEDDGTHGSTDGDIAIHLDTGQDGAVTISNCIVNGGSYGFYVDDVAHDIDIWTNRLNDQTFRGMYIYSTDDVRMYNNFINDFLYYGIYALTCNGLIISGNRCIGKNDSLSGDKNAYGIYLQSVTDSVIQGNFITIDNSRTETSTLQLRGIVAYTSTDNNFILNNGIILDNNQTGVQSIGFYFYYADSNFLSYNSVDGIYDTANQLALYCYISSGNYGTGNISMNTNGESGTCGTIGWDHY